MFQELQNWRGRDRQTPGACWQVSLGETVNSRFSKRDPASKSKVALKKTSDADL